MTTAAVTARLEAALARWCRTGAATDATAFEALARAALEGFTPPITSSSRTFQRAWLRMVNDEIGRGWALDTLTEQLPGTDAFQRASALAKRIEALARHGPDPRFDKAIAMARCADGVVHMQRLVTALSRLDDAAFAAATAEATPVTELPPATPEITALWQAVQAHPDDDGPLAVLADALQLAGDPRGELIALELVAGDDDPARIERRKALIASCGATWLGRLTQVAGAASFERGFVRRLQLSGLRPASDPGWAALCADAALATVTDLLPADASSTVYALFITSPAMRSLARIEVYDRVTLEVLADTPPSIMHIVARFPFGSELSSALGACRGLRSIAIASDSFDQLAAAPWFARLTAVTLGVGGGGVRAGLARWATLPRTMTLTLVPSAELAPCAIGFPWDFAITLARDGDATVARISGEWLLLPVDVLTALPADVVRVEVDHPSEAIADRVRSAVPRAGLDIVHRPVPRTAAVFVPTLRDRIRNVLARATGLAPDRPASAADRGHRRTTRSRYRAAARIAPRAARRAPYRNQPRGSRSAGARAR